MNKNEFKAEAARIGKLLGVIPTMDNYTFSDPKSPVFQIKEKELRSVVRKAKALKDPEAHGIDDIEWDFEEGYICFMLPGGFALYLSTEADMEMNEANEANAALNTRAANKMNESSKSELLKLAQTAAKSLGIKFKETPSSYKALMGASFEITEKDFIKIINAFKRSQSDPAAFGFYEMTFDNPEMSVLIDFEDEEDSILFYVGGMSESSESNAANEATNTLNEASEDRMRKKARAIAKFFGVEIDETVGSFGFFASSAGIDKSSYDKIIKIINQTKNIEKKLGVNFIEVWSKVNSIRFNVYRSEDDIFFKLQGMNESYDHIPEYTPRAAMNEGMPSKSEALKFAQTFAKFLGIAYKESDDTWNGAGAFFEISQKGLKKAINKIRKEQGTKQLKLGEVEMFTTGPVVEKLNVDEVEIDDQEGYIRFTKGTKDVYFQADWASDDKELLNESTEAVELNEVTGLPKYKTSVPSHML